MDAEFRTLFDAQPFGPDITQQTIRKQAEIDGVRGWQVDVDVLGAVAWLGKPHAIMARWHVSVKCARHAGAQDHGPRVVAISTSTSARAE